jgi:hypothetical protein
MQMIAMRTRPSSARILFDGAIAAYAGDVWNRRAGRMTA